MATLYRRSDSRFWWMKYFDAAGKLRQESTKLRVDVTGETRKAHELRRELSLRERDRPTMNEAWDAWVHRFLDQRYGHAPSTLTRYKNGWRSVAAFLRANEIYVPRQLARQQVRDFIEWRQARHPGLGVYEVCKNTALHDVKVLRIVMGEAVASGFCAANPCAKLDVKPDKPARKPRITDDEHAIITKALLKEPEWMQVSFAIAWHQGCRFSETCIPLSDVDLERRVLRLRTKGKKDSLAEFPINPELVEMFRHLKSRGAGVTYIAPLMPGKAWWNFFRRIKMGHLCFHCTRVTFITRCYEAGIPRDSVMRLCGHSSYAAHEIYPRLSADHGQLQELMGRMH